MSYINPYKPSTEGKRLAPKPRNDDVTLSEYKVEIDPAGYELLKAITVEMYSLLPLPNASEALEDALDEMKRIHEYYLNKSLNAALRLVSPPQQNVRLINKIDVVSKPKQIPYDSAE